MPAARQERLKRLSERWPLLLAAVFALYSALLLYYADSSWRLLRREADAFLVADNLRRANALSDLAADLRSTAAANAEINEISTYLTSRDLGMSPLYGLNALRAAIAVRFQQRAEKFTARWKSDPWAISYFSPTGNLLADSGAPNQAVTSPTTEAASDARIDVSRGILELAAPVVHKGINEGYVVTSIPLGVLRRNLLEGKLASGYRELLLTLDSPPVTVTKDPAGTTPHPLQEIAAFANDVVVSISTRTSPAADQPEPTLLVKSRVPDLPIALVTFVPERMAYGHITSRHLLIGAGVLLLFMLLGTIKLDQIRRRAERLETDMKVAERSRMATENHNRELSAEIRRREQVEKALAESQERWELAISGANDGIWDWNVVTGDVFYSSRWKSMLGYDDADLAGRVEEWSKLLHPEDTETVMSQLKRHMAGQTDYFENVQRLRCKDGSYKWILARGRALFDTTGAAIRMVGSHTDITQRILNENQLAERTIQLDTIFALSPDGFVSFDSQHRVKYANPAFADLTGFHTADLIGEDEATFADLLAGICLPGTPTLQIAALRTLLEAGTPAEDTTIRLSLNRDKRVLEVKLRLASAGSVSQILYVRNVTHEVEVDRMKSEFLSHAAHELRTPMASIFGFSELLLSRDFDEETRRDLLDTIYKQSTWLVEIINELLDLARIDSRRGKEFKIEAVDLAGLVAEVVEAHQIDASRWPLLLNLPAGLPAARADHAKLRQALTNVLGNAVKYSPEGGAIEIACLTREAGTVSYVGLRVTDHGIGLTREQAARIGERFYREIGRASCRERV